jgi:peptidoglycan/xylan/chitin deacetylase (PgdA/CDA1 family)
MGVDRALINFLRREKIPATLFINARWIGPNLELFAELAADPLFEIANHGLGHKPASVNGRSVYGIEGTADVGELVDEIELAARRLHALTDKSPAFYRSGTGAGVMAAVPQLRERGLRFVRLSEYPLK